ncbi:MAG: hypothetical protein E7022_05440 [Desulfovibrio desulfuricans]|jgi:hypothetical protein|nr:hypothetical protein [Desulfovibrio desulfuricans]
MPLGVVMSLWSMRGPFAGIRGVTMLWGVRGRLVMVLRSIPMVLRVVRRGVMRLMAHGRIVVQFMGIRAVVMSVVRRGRTHAAAGQKQQGKTGQKQKSFHGVTHWSVLRMYGHLLFHSAHKHG